MPFFDDGFYGSRFKKYTEGLPLVFKELTGREFDFGNADDRRLMQVAMLVLQTKGLSIGEYSWDFAGVGRLRCFELDVDLRKCFAEASGKLGSDELRLVHGVRDEFMGKPMELVEVIGVVYYMLWVYGRGLCAWSKERTLEKVSEVMKVGDAKLLEEAWESGRRLLGLKGI